MSEKETITVADVGVLDVDDIDKGPKPLTREEKGARTAIFREAMSQLEERAQAQRIALGELTQMRNPTLDELHKAVTVHIDCTRGYLATALHDLVQKLIVKQTDKVGKLSRYSLEQISTG